MCLMPPSQMQTDCISTAWFCWTAGGVTKEYKTKLRMISANLKDSTNPTLRRKVLVGEITPDGLVRMESADMASEVRSVALPPRIMSTALLVCSVDSRLPQHSQLRNGQIDLAVGE